MARTTTLFSKRPVSGAVKTRLVPPLTGGQAAALAQALLDDAVAALGEDASLNTGIAVAPAEAAPWFGARYPGLAIEPQVGAGLAARLANWFEAHCRADATTVVIGSDCPLVDADVARAAHAALDAGADAVFVPDSGGGYCLVGLRRSVPALFRDVVMSTDSMLAATLEVAEAAGLEVTLLPELYDIDTEHDLARLRRDLTNWPTRSFPRRTADFLSSLDLSRV